MAPLPQTMIDRWTFAQECVHGGAYQPNAGRDGDPGHRAAVYG
ncbi:hypothetical protein [Mycobacterium sp.]|nr:hypothetical protein [Mycobacterium sp.]